MAIEQLCIICGSGVWIDAKTFGCKVYCDNCESDGELMEQERNRVSVPGARELYWRAQREQELAVDRMVDADIDYWREGRERGNKE